MALYVGCNTYLVWVPQYQKSTETWKTFIYSIFAGFLAAWGQSPPPKRTFPLKMQGFFTCSLKSIISIKTLLRSKVEHSTVYTLR